MKISIYLLSLILFSASAFAQKPFKKKHGKVWVFIMAGQSNMAGRGKLEAEDTTINKRVFAINEKGEVLPAKEPLHFYEPKMKGTSCGLAFGKELVQHIPKDVTVLLIPTAVGGSSIDQWLNNSIHREVPLLANFKEKVELAKQYGEIKAVLWHQGESDANRSGIPQHREKLKRLFLEFRTSIGNPSLPILMGELGSFSKMKEQFEKMNDELRQFTTEDPNTAIIATGDLKDLGDALHFNSASQREMGKRFALEYLNKFAENKNGKK